MTSEQKEIEIRKSIELATILLNPLKRPFSLNIAMDIKLAIKVLNRALDFHYELQGAGNCEDN